MACGSAFGIVSLRRLVGAIGGTKTVGRGLILEGAISPATAVRKPLAVLHHEIHIVKGTRDERLAGVGFLFFRLPMNFCHLGTIGEGLAVPRNTRLECLDHGGFPRITASISPL